MSSGTRVVTCFLRNKSDVLLLRRSAETPTYPGKWGGVSGLIESETPRDTAERELTEETGVTETTMVRAGDPFTVDDPPQTWEIHTFLFETDNRTVSLNKEHESYQWTSPSEIPRLDTVPCLWKSYQHVAPTLESLSTDTTHGSTYLSIRALDVLRDTATASAVTQSNTAQIVETAVALRDARPSMTALTNRVNRVMATADNDPRAIETTCQQIITDAYTADESAAAIASEKIQGKRVLTHSRSGTVVDAITQSDANVTITESHPGDEGTTVAVHLATHGYNVTLIADAATAHVLHTHDIDMVLVGADTILPDGSIFNKIGTQTIATAAHEAGIPIFVVAATDKITYKETTENETGDPNELYTGPEDISIYTPRFDTTPPTHITGYITENGILGQDDIQSIATQHEQSAGWKNAT